MPEYNGRRGETGKLADCFLTVAATGNNQNSASDSHTDTDGVKNQNGNSFSNDSLELRFELSRPCRASIRGELICIACRVNPGRPFTDYDWQRQGKGNHCLFFKGKSPEIPAQTKSFTEGKAIWESF